MAGIIEFSGTVLAGPAEERQGLWSVDGCLTFHRPPAAPDVVLDGWVLPGFVDAHCHIGLGPGGAVPDEVAEHATGLLPRHGSVIRHGRIADEVLSLHRAGLPPAAALDAACWGARAWLGADGLSEGASADDVVCREDPRSAPATVSSLQNVVLRGEVIR